MKLQNGNMNSSEQMVKHHLMQPALLPESVREIWGTESIQLYALIDLDAHFRLCESWLILGDSRLALVFKSQKGIWNLRTLDLDDVARVSEMTGLSCNRMSLFNEQDECLLSVRYSHRQSRAVGLIKFVIEQWSVENKTDTLSSSDEGRNADKLYQEGVLRPVKEAQASFSGGDARVVWRLMSYLRPYRRKVTLGMAGALLMTTVSLVPAYLTGFIVDHVIKPFQSGGLTMSQASQLATLTVTGLVTTYFFRELFAWIRLRTMSVIGEKVARDLRNEVYTHLHRLSLDFFGSKQTGSLISRVGSDTDRIWDFIAFGVVEVTTSVMMLAGLSFVLLSLDWSLGLVVTIPVPVLLWVIVKHGERMNRLFLRAWRKWSNLTDCLSDTIPGIRVVKAFNRQDYETGRFISRNQAVVTEFNRIHRTWTTFWPFLMLSIHTIVAVVWVFGVPRVLEHIASVNVGGATDVGLSPGVLISFVLYMSMFVQPIEVIGQMSRMVNRATSSAQRVFEVLDTEPQILESKDPVSLKTLRGEISFENVSFSYDGVRKVIKNLSFQVKPGEMIGLVGPSGGGKTTITNLLARFFDVTGGRILIDGKDLRDVDLELYRSQLGMVLQEPYLFHGSILENIRYAKPEASLKQVVEAAKVANAHEFIVRLPHGYDSTVGERGHTLSGGERQRISIARAVLRNPKILILDEATSAVDTETEKKIQEALDRLTSGRTVFAVAHRLSTLAKADRLFVVKTGEIMESGTHADLMKIEKGLYRKLITMQQDLQKV